MKPRRNNMSYSESFKQYIVREVEEGRISIEGARRKYGIGGTMTISKWRKKYVRLREELKLQGVPMPKQEDLRMLELEKQNQELKKMLMEKDTELLIYKTMVEISENMKDPEVKKKIEEALLKQSLGKSDD